MIVNGDTKLNHWKRYEYTLDAYNEKGEKNLLPLPAASNCEKARI
ncbi:hypothetical protein KQI61_00885 [Anaerocolumna aminovalerica]|nr:hypothetical protein [Anaerocolumna aminovalerica]